MGPAHPSLRVGTLATGSPVLDGAFTLGSQVTLDVSKPADNIFGDFASVKFLAGGTLIVGGSSQELWIQQLMAPTAVAGGSATIIGNGGKILYDTLPSFLNDDNTLVSGTAVLTVGTVSFDYLTKGGTLNGGTYMFTAGTVRDRGGTLLDALAARPDLPAGVDIKIKASSR